MKPKSIRIDVLQKRVIVDRETYNYVNHLYLEAEMRGMLEGQDFHDAFWQGHMERLFGNQVRALSKAGVVKVVSI